MSYYMQGDPSFLGALWGAVTGYVTGGPAGAVAGAIAGSHGTGVHGSPTPAAAGGAATYGPTHLAQYAGAAGYGAGRAVRAIGQHPYLSAAGAAAGGGGLIAAHLIHGRGRGGAAIHPVTGQPMRRRRRMNVCNPRALRRAIRRAKGFEKLALRSIRLVNPRRLHGKRRGGFKVRRRRA